MADESKSIALAILGIVAVLAVVGLVLMFVGNGAAGAATQFTQEPGRYREPAGMEWNAYGQHKYFDGNPCGEFPSGDPEGARTYVKCLQDLQATYGYI